MKLSEILGWDKEIERDPEALEHIRALIHGHNTALTSCDRDVDREALAKVLMDIQYSGHQRWSYLHEDQRQQFEFEAAEIISTMPKWLKRSE